MGTATIMIDLRATGRQVPAVLSATLPAPLPPWQDTEAPRYQGGTVLRQHSRRWAGLTAVLSEVRADGPMQVDVGGEAACLSVVLEETGGRIGIEADSRAAPALPACRTPLSLVAPGRVVRLVTSGMRHLIHLVLRFDPDGLAGLMDEPIDLGAAFGHRPAFPDAPLLALCRLIAGECAPEGSQVPAHGPLYGDSLSVALLLRLVQLGGIADEPSRTGGLTPWQMKRVVEHIEANYAEEVPLDRLAGLARLSTSHFSRAFKRSAGVSPHQWLIDLRCAKAKQMMLDGRLPLAEIALATGFSDQSHFTRAFGQSNGMPPATWRRAQTQREMAL